MAVPHFITQRRPRLDPFGVLDELERLTSSELGRLAADCGRVRTLRAWHLLDQIAWVLLCREFSA